MSVRGRPDNIDRLAAVLFERFCPYGGPFGKTIPIWSQAHPDTREEWRTVAKEVLKEADLF